MDPNILNWNQPGGPERRMIMPWDPPRNGVYLVPRILQVLRRHRLTTTPATDPNDITTGTWKKTQKDAFAFSELMYMGEATGRPLHDKGMIHRLRPARCSAWRSSLVRWVLLCTSAFPTCPPRWYIHVNRMLLSARLHVCNENVWSQVWPCQKVAKAHFGLAS